MRFLLIGLASGFYGALLGVGGGVIIIPLLVVAAGFAEREAAATSLAAIGLTALAGALFFAFHGFVDVREAALVGLPAATAVVFGTRLQQRLKTRTLTILFAAFLAVAGVDLLLR